MTCNTSDLLWETIDLDFQKSSLITRKICSNSENSEFFFEKNAFLTWTGSFSDQ